MPSIKKTKIIPYTQSQMYALVNDVTEYKSFVPWCVESRILSETESEVRATLGFSSGGFTKSFSTLNRLKPHKRIEIGLLDGPFKHLEGFWQFDEVDKAKSQVSLQLEFEFSTKLFGMMFGPIFNQVASSLVEAFCKRAEDVYGTK